MNAHSSRSHAIMIIKIEKHIRISEDRKQDLFSLEKEKIMKERLMTKIYSEMTYFCTMRIEDSVAKSVYFYKLLRDFFKWKLH